MPASTSMQNKISVSPHPPSVSTHSAESKAQLLGPKDLENFSLEWTIKINWEIFPKVYQLTLPFSPLQS